MAGELTNRVIVLTGAAGGIGRATAERLADEGARLVLSDREAAVADVAAAIVAAGGEAIAVVADVTVAAQVARMFPGNRIFEVMSYIERRMAPLPGMEGLDICSKWAASIQPLLPEAQRVAIPAQQAAA